MAKRFVTANLKLASPDWEMAFKATVPEEPMAFEELLPLARDLSDAIAQAAVGEIEARGGKISCRKGCGACCRQLVPISETEARRLAELVASWPEPRQSLVRARFAKAVAWLAEAGLLEKLRRPESWYGEEGYREFGLKYFQQKIPCPFLEDESCSIYSERPITCREFLVTTPAENCQDPAREVVRSVKLPMSAGPAFAKLGSSENAPAARWVALVLALEWAAANPAPSPSRGGRELLGELLQHLTGATPPMGPHDVSTPETEHHFPGG
jgi:Fe-S-cluster containining protein